MCIGAKSEIKCCSLMRRSSISTDLMAINTVGKISKQNAPSFFTTHSGDDELVVWATISVKEKIERALTTTTLNRRRTKLYWKIIFAYCFYRKYLIIVKCNAPIQYIRYVGQWFSALKIDFFGLEQPPFQTWSLLKNVCSLFTRRAYKKRRQFGNIDAPKVI